jgi:tetratricopeptide (TPR) repeat protein
MSDQTPEDKPVNVTSTTDIQVGKIADGGQLTAFKATGSVENLYLVQNIQASTVVAGAVARQPGALTAPRSRQTFFGRDEKIAQANHALQDGQSVLLYGLGGIGKTALAGEVARQMEGTPAFQGGVLWLSDVGGAPLPAICDAIARNLGDDQITQFPPEGKPDAVRQLLGSRQNLLLVLDRLEDPATAQDFMDTCLPQDMPMLATSRRLHTCFSDPLELPALKREEAMALFQDRSKVAGQGAMIDAICDLLGDHPLALVIAASRVRTEGLSLDRLIARLNDEKGRLKALSVGQAENPNQNVYASLNLSYTMLNPDQQRLFRLLAACFGKTTGLELLAKVCGCSQDDCEDLLGQLVVLSLADRENDRARLQPLVRDFGRALLADQLDAAQASVVEAVLAYAQTYTARTDDHYDKLDVELTNLMGSVRFAAEHNQPQQVLTLAGILAMPRSGVLALRGYWAQLVATGDLAIQAAESLADQKQIARWCHNTAVALSNQGNFDEAQKLWERAYALFLQLNDPSGQAAVLNSLGSLMYIRGEVDKADELYQKSLALKQAQGDQLGAARSLHNLGRSAQNRGDYKTAHELVQQSLAIKKSLPGQPALGLGYLALGEIAQIQGDHDLARQQFQLAMQAFQRDDEVAGVTEATLSLARLKHAEGDYAGARQDYESCLEAFQTIGDPDGQADCLLDLGRLAIDTGSLDAARSPIDQSLALRKKQQDLAGTADCQRQLGRLALAQGDLQTARQDFEQDFNVRVQLKCAPGQADSLYDQGLLAVKASQPGQALLLFTQSKALSDQLGLAALSAENALELGRLALAGGKPDQARPLLEQAVAQLTRLHAPALTEAQKLYSECEPGVAPLTP